MQIKGPSSVPYVPDAPVQRDTGAKVDGKGGCEVRDHYDFKSAECHELAAQYQVSLFTAARWIRKGKERSIARHLERKAAQHLAEHRPTTAHGWPIVGDKP